MEDMGGAEAPETAVTEEGVEAPTNSEENSPSLEAGDDQASTEQKAEEMISRQEFNKRISNLRAESERKYQKQLHERLQQVLQQYEEPIRLHMALQQDPEKARILAQILSGQAPQQPQEPDPYAEFDPVIAERLRKDEAMERKVEEIYQYLERQHQQQQNYQQQQALETARNSAEGVYSALLKADGIAAKAGDPLSEGLDRVTAGFLLDIAKNPEMPTEAEIKEAYAQTKAFMNAARKMALKGVSTAPVPPTGSRFGVSPSMGSKGPKTDTQQARVNNILSIMN